MAEPMKIRAKMEGDAADVKVLMSHEMETGQRKDSSGKLVPAHFIATVTVTHAGKTVLAEMPVIRQCFVGRGESCADQDAFERKLLAIRKQTQNPLAAWQAMERISQLIERYRA